MPSARQPARWLALPAWLWALGCLACSAAPLREPPREGRLSRPDPLPATAAVPEPGPIAASKIDGNDAPPPANDAGEAVADALEASVPAEREPFALAIDGFEPAVVVPPDESSPAPWRLIVVLHGNFDRPEWECETWRAAARQSWLVCPRGIPREDADPALDRWTYRTAHDVATETAAAVAALREAHPDEVREDGAVLIGFSLGAHMAWRVAASRSAPVFELLVFGEGGYFVEVDSVRKAVDRGVHKVLFLCGELTRCTTSVEQAERRWRSGGAEVERIVMPGTAHAYAADFEPVAEQILQWLLADDDPITLTP
jgi:dienelactone hydrolase